MSDGQGRAVCESRTWRVKSSQKLSSLSTEQSTGVKAEGRQTRGRVGVASVAPGEEASEVQHLELRRHGNQFVGADVQKPA